MGSRLVAITVLLGTACTGPGKPPSGTGSATAEPPGSDAMQKDPNAKPGQFTRGVALVPTTALLQWLESQKRDIGKRVTVRLPVTLAFVNSQLSMRGATIGTAADAIVLELDDTALGISLEDRVRGKCPPGSTTCAVWLEGQWRGVDDGRGQFFITKVGDMIDPGGAPDHVEIESP